MDPFFGYGTRFFIKNDRTGIFVIQPVTHDKFDLVKRRQKREIFGDIPVRLSAGRAFDIQYFDAFAWHGLYAKAAVGFKKHCVSVFKQKRNQGYGIRLDQRFPACDFDQIAPVRMDFFQNRVSGKCC